MTHNPSQEGRVIPWWMEDKSSLLFLVEHAWLSSRLNMAPVCQSKSSRAILRNRWNRKQNLVGHYVQSTELHNT